METINTAPKDNGNLNNNQPEVLAEMGEQFDPDEAKNLIEKEKQSTDQNKNIKVVSPATKVIIDGEGHFTIESEYFGVYYAYEKSGDFDRHNPEDMKLGEAIWDVGFASAMLDCDKGFRRQLEQGGIIDVDTLSPDAAKHYKEAYNGLLEIAGCADSDKADRLMEQMEKAGPIGEYFSNAFGAICDIKASGMTIAPYEIPSPDDVDFDILEQEYANLTSGKGLSAEAINDLYAKYSELSKTITDPKVLEKVKQRANSLFSLNNKLEEINKKTSSFDL